ncbi:MAG: DUF4058 family protein [Anaerolineae bacterium]
MPSPFPGMDPYLEGHLWPDVHAALAAQIRQQLTPLLRPRYAARLAVYVVEDTSPEADIGIMYPDVEILRPRSQERQIREDTPARLTAPRPVAPLVVGLPLPVEVHLTGIEIRDAANNELITGLEILSPVNKREPGLSVYREKRRRLYRAGVHLVEIDLIRRGTRPLAHPRIPPSPYLVTLTRAHAATVEVWPIALEDRLPLIPTPLRAPDADVTLDLHAALAAVYEAVAYDLSIDYGGPPPPPPLDSDPRLTDE